jgi:hypothetical protein
MKKESQEGELDGVGRWRSREGNKIDLKYVVLEMSEI